MADDAEISLEAGDNDVPTLSLGEAGYNGLNVLGGEILEECSKELRWPHAINTFKRMEKDGAIAPALAYVEMMISRVDWHVKIPEGYEEQLKDHAIFMRQVMNDMEHDFKSFIKQAVSFNRYGFAPVEKVFRLRYKEKGSQYDDGLVGIRKLALRSQDTIQSWKFVNKGRDLAGLYQYINIPSSRDYNQGIDFVTNYEAGNVKFIPRKKFMLFRHNPIKDNPEGQSPLVGCWSAWKYKTAYQESEAISVAQDSNGFKVLYLPPQYMAADATDENKAVFEHYKTVIRNMHQAKESGLILPLIVDDQGNKMFEFEIKSVTGQKSYDTNAIIKRYTAEILTALFADFLALGSDGSGSFSLAESKISVVEMAIQSKLDEIKTQLNFDLAKQLFQLNGWSTEVMPEWCYGEVGKVSLDEISKFIQRTAAVGLIPKAPKVVNWLMDQASIPYKVDEDLSVEELSKQLTPETSNSGAGMVEGMSNGTGSSNGSSGDSSTSNSENT
ncbi:MAG: hypothetical protein PUP93_06655 [Rhizonema sp. NSF051]|nr:hypothetical protein [Rhizonema sp. NSF051]